MRVTKNSLPKVMVAILAMEADDQAEIRQVVVPILSDALMRDVRERARGQEPTLAEILREILSLPREDRAAFAERLDDALDVLLEGDFFGTEGQTDPRGDRRG